jgi:hypothetical protein
MRKLLIGLTFAALALPASALGGGWATVGVGQPPDDMGPGQTWDAKVTVLQHGNPDTPLYGVTPTLTIKNGATTRTFKGTPTNEAGVSTVRVVFPSKGKWSYTVHDGFTRYGGDQVHTFAPVSIGLPVAGDGGGFPVLPVTAVIALMLGLGAVLYLLARRWRVRAPAPTH